MARHWPIFLVLVALAALGWLVLGRGDDSVITDGVERGEGEEYVPPELRGHAPGENWRNPTVPRPAPPRPEDPAGVLSDEPQVFLEGRVESAETEEPIARAAVWIVPHEEPCPRLPATVWTPSRPFDPRFAAATDKEGRFAFRGPAGYGPSIGRFDVVANAAGYVLGMECSPTLPGPVTFRLVKALSIEGQVLKPDGRGIVGASVRARPGPETPPTPGHGTVGTAETTNRKGGFTLDGLLPGEVLVDADHLHYMPKTAGPYDPATSGEVEITLTPALRATFKIRTDDGRDPEHPTLVWQTVEPSPRSEVLLLKHAPYGTDGKHPVPPPAQGEMTTVPVRLPCDAPSVILRIRADGYATWTSDALRLPSEGGEKTFEVTLSGDLATGSARITLEDDRGEKVSFVGADVQTGVQRMDPGARASAYVLMQTEDLTIADLPAGSYRIQMVSRLFAPAQADIVVTVGQTAESLVRVRPPAKVRVRFISPEQTLVRFRLTQDGSTPVGVPDGTFRRGTDEKTGEPILAAGSEGLLLSGLASGAYTVEVLSEELTAPSTVVQLVEGDTREVEIYVRPR